MDAPATTNDATLHLNSWAGHRTYQIRIVGETLENFRFEALEDIPMPRRRWLKAGEYGRAPKSAVTHNALGNRLPATGAAKQGEEG